MRSSAFWEDIHSPFDRLRERPYSLLPTPCFRPQGCGCRNALARSFFAEKTPMLKIRRKRIFNALLYIKVKNYPVFSRVLKKNHKKTNKSSSASYFFLPRY
jgi:hypothetical protein